MSCSSLFVRKICDTNSLDPKKVKGKIVVCMRDTEVPRILKGMNVKKAGGAGMILCNNEIWGDILFADPHVLPSTMISYNNSFALLSYMNSTK
jgi:PA domain